MRISVVVPTYRRVQDLKRCLAGIDRSRRMPDEVIVTVRDDPETDRLLLAEAGGRIQRVAVSQPGVIAAMNAGAAMASGDVIALTDDDAAPWSDWLARIERHFADDPKLGAVGGRDWQYKGEPLTLDDGCENRAGEMQWWGRVVGQHHWAAPGPAREVAVIKGVNCAFRAEALRQVGGFDTRLAGTGAQVHWELAVCLAMKRSGWKVLFDPAIGVDHFPAIRFDEDQRATFVPAALQNAVANETLVLLEHFGVLRRGVFLAWALVIGTRASPGVLQTIRLLGHRQQHPFRRFVATCGGRWVGLQMYFRSRRDRFADSGLGDRIRANEPDV